VSNVVASTPSRRGRQIAQLFRQSRGLLETRACDLGGILTEAELEVVSSKYDDPGYAALLLRFPEGGGGIMIAANQSDGRRRFSLAHELGHFFIPSHAAAGPTLKCADTDLRARSSDSKTQEWEANDFAAELLMPRALFSADARHRPIDFGTVEFLAGSEMYQVSRTAAAWRLVQSTREQCALVMSVNGAIEWVARSDSFSYWIPERGQSLGKDTVAAAVRRGESPILGAEQVSPLEWFEGSPGQSFDRVEIFESAYPIPSRAQIMSLVWARERDDEDDGM
jgi:Zn-dependent peptidase ImmA (M78 family)